MVYLEKDRGDDPAREREETDTDRERRECFALGDLLQNNTMLSQLSLWFKHTHSNPLWQCGPPAPVTIASTATSTPAS
jgi:hypothetical protein